MHSCIVVSYHEKKGNQHKINVPIIMPNKFKKHMVKQSNHNNS